jgi:sulfatase maturation enzyme AslB (radical SAM superfamily)
MIHGGLNLNFKTAVSDDQAMIRHCCFRSEQIPVTFDYNFWHNPQLEKLRETNNQNVWDAECASTCRSLESANEVSFRTGMNEGLQMTGQTNLSGPLRIDLTFDISCNLACRSCSALSSTFWQKHLKNHGEWPGPISSSQTKDKVIKALSNLDLSNLKQLVFCGGETLLGNEYWAVAEWLGNNVPNAKKQLTLCFQTNGTQSIPLKYFDTIEKFHLVRFHISLDGIQERFEYLRWPASWNQVVDNIMQIRETVPSNVMFLIEETISIFNLGYTTELDSWAQNNFSTNREGDTVNHTKHLAGGIFTLQNMSQEYVNGLGKYRELIPSNWREDPQRIATMIGTIKKFDQYRNQSFRQTMPEVAEYYNRYLK